MYTQNRGDNIHMIIRCLVFAISFFWLCAPSFSGTVLNANNIVPSNCRLMSDSLISVDQSEKKLVSPYNKDVTVNDHLKLTLFVPSQIDPRVKKNDCY